MLAGRMKLNTFLLGVAAVLAAGIGVAAWMLVSQPAAPPPVVIADVPQAPVAPSARPAPALPANPAPTNALSGNPGPAGAALVTAAAPADAREVDKVVLSYVGKPIGADKLKDVTKGKPFKVNVYQDGGSPTANRAKVDLDRDDKWDEKFTFEDGTITRDVAPADDESYTEHLRWDGHGWVTAG